MSTAAAIDLSPFCDTRNNLRYSITKPFVRNKWRCATDACIAVMVPADGEPDMPTDGSKVPDVPTLIYQMHCGNHVWFPWPQSVEVKDSLQECCRCEGSGAFHTKECPDCHGSGYTKCGECNQDVECEECEGDGTINCGKCPDCDGKKKLVQPWSCSIGGRNIKEIYASKVRELPGVEYAATEHAILFRADGGLLGAVMTLVDE